MASQKIALIIDDDPDIVDEVKFMLKNQLQYLVLAATDPEVAVDLAKHYAFDLLILDLHMPKLDGFQVLELVRKKQPQVKVIVVTGFYDQYKDRYKSAKIDKIIEKPIEPSHFAKDIIAIAGRVDLPVIKEADKVTKAKILLVDDEVDICESFKEWLVEAASSEYEVEIAKDGNEGILMNNQFEPDIIFFDIKMPHMNGIEMADHIKRGDGHKPKLYLALSADGYQTVIDEIQSKGFMVFTKPFRIEKVLEFLRDKCLELGLYTAANE